MPQMLASEPFSTLRSGVESGGERGDKTFSTTTPYRVGGGGGGGRPQSGGGEPCRGPLCLVPFNRREGLTIEEAAEIAGKSVRTLRLWCEQYQVGRRVGGGSWVVSRVALEMLLDGNAGALRAYLSGDRSDPTVVHYFQRAGLEDLIRYWRSNGAATSAMMT